jgi:transposase InsO family protein
MTRYGAARRTERHHRAPTDEGKLYCAAVMAVFSRRIISWPIAARQDTELVINALSMAVTRRQPEKGKQYYIPITARNTRHGRSASESATPGSSARWER